MSNAVYNVVKKALDKGEAQCKSRNALTGDYGVSYAASKSAEGIFKFEHWGTVILEFDMHNKVILKWYGYSNSDRDALNEIMSIFNQQAWKFSIKQGKLMLIHADVEYSIDMQPVMDDTAKLSKKKLDAFMKEFSHRIDSGSVSDAGECWLVKGVVHPDSDNCKTCPYLGDAECGGGVTLIAKALKENRNTDTLIQLAVENPLRWKDIIMRAVRKYVRKRLQA
jgi:ribosomal protein S28E/S33